MTDVQKLTADEVHQLYKSLHYRGGGDWRTESGECFGQSDIDAILSKMAHAWMEERESPAAEIVEREVLTEARNEFARWLKEEWEYPAPAYMDQMADKASEIFGKLTAEPAVEAKSGASHLVINLLQKLVDEDYEPSADGSFTVAASRIAKTILREVTRPSPEVIEGTGQEKTYEKLYHHAISCVDRVFQDCAENPNPILPDFLKLGEDKFEGVVKLAERLASVQEAWIAYSALAVFGFHPEDAKDGMDARSELNRLLVIEMPVVPSRPAFVAPEKPEMADPKFVRHAASVPFFERGPAMKRTRLAEALRLWILTNEIEQKSLAEEWGCSESTVTRFLAGSSLPEPNTMLTIFQWCLATGGPLATERG